MAAVVIGVAIMTQAGIASAATVHKASDDDTFWKLSSEYGVSVDALVQANSEIDPLNIYEGLDIVIPDENNEPDTEANAAAALKTVATLNAAKAESAKTAKTAASNAVAAAASKKSSTLNLGGRSFNYSNVLQMKASAYTADPSENGGWGAVDYLGNPLKLGTIAVDPNVIPLGSKVYVTGYSHDGLPQGGMIMTASDKGGAIKGNKIDIFLPQSQQKARTFGIQYVKVYILE